jgi:hypothetical protein
MKKHLTYALAASLLATTSVAQERGQWRAASKTAQSITGDVAFGGEKISINFASFTIAQIRPLSATEATTLFHAEPGAPATGNLYRVAIPAARRFLHKNTLCGAEETDWIITYIDGKTLQTAMFSDPRIPDLTPEAMANGTTLCGIYTYVR